MQFRGLELHGKTFWSAQKIERALDIIQAYDLNTLVIHESDFMTEFFFPTAFFNPAAPWDGAPARRGENALHNNLVYFRDLLKRARRRGVAVWLEVKEITFPDEVVEKHPAVIKNGVICPTDPLWAQVIRAKYADLVRFFPEVGGVIVSAGSPEGKAALSQKKCSCDRCRSTGMAEWYRSILDPMYEVLSPAGLRLAVREFSYNLNHQTAITEAMNGMPADVVYCIKVTAHDFYPTFPDNTLIERVTDRPTWIEYDTMGQYYGWGLIPCFMRDDIEARFSYARRHGVDGAVLRVEWERLNDYWSLDGPNRMNMLLCANAALGRPNDPAAVIARWLHEEGVSFSADELALLTAYLNGTWSILKKALYINDFVLNDSSMVPPSIERGWWSMDDKHSLSEWAPDREGELQLSDERLKTYLAEKDAAVQEIEQWHARIAALDADSWVMSFLRRTVALTRRYVQLFAAMGRLCLYAGLADQRGASLGAADREALADAATELQAQADQARAWLDASDLRHHIYLLFNPDRCEALVAGARARLERLAAGGQ